MSWHNDNRAAAPVLWLRHFAPAHLELCLPPDLLPPRVPQGPPLPFTAPQNQLCSLNPTHWGREPYFRPFGPSDVFPRCDAQTVTGYKPVLVEVAVKPCSCPGKAEAVKTKRCQLIREEIATSLPRETDQRKHLRAMGGQETPAAQINVLCVSPCHGSSSCNRSDPPQGFHIAYFVLIELSQPPTQSSQ